MMAGRREGTSLLAFLLIVCGALTWLIYQQLQASPRPTAAKPSPVIEEVELPPLPSVAVFSLEPIETFEDIVLRPLFSPTRRPPDGEAPIVTPTATEESLELGLAGILYSAQQRIALFSAPGEKGLLRLREGDRYRGWTLKSVLPDHVVFSRNEVESEVTLSYVRTQAPVDPRRARKRKKEQE